MGGIIVKKTEQKVDSDLLKTNFRLDSDGTARTIMNEKHQNIQKKLASHQCRLNLQRRRKLVSFKRNGLGGQIQVYEGMMTMSDKLYSWGESSDAAFIPRCVGLLGEAEHFGKL